MAKIEDFEINKLEGNHFQRRTMENNIATLINNDS